MFDFERLHQAARDARAKGQRKVMLPHGEFRQAMLTFYAVTKGKRALDQIEEGRFSFSAWGLPPERDTGKFNLEYASPVTDRRLSALE